MGEFLERVNCSIEVRVQDWLSSGKRRGRRLAGVVGMHTPCPRRAVSVQVKREAHCCQAVTARVRSGHELLRIFVQYGLVVGVANVVKATAACVGQGRLRQNRLIRCGLGGMAGAVFVVIGDLYFQPLAQIASGGNVRVRRTPFRNGDIRVGAGLGCRMLPLPRLVAEVLVLVAEVREEPDADLRQPQVDLGAVDDPQRRRPRPSYANPCRQRGADSKLHALAVVVLAVHGRREAKRFVGLVAIFFFLVVTFFRTERQARRHVRVFVRGDPAPIGHRYRYDELALGVFAQCHPDRIRPSLGRGVVSPVQIEKDLHLDEILVFALGAGWRSGEEDCPQHGDQNR